MKKILKLSCICLLCINIIVNNPTLARADENNPSIDSKEMAATVMMATPEIYSAKDSWGNTWGFIVTSSVSGKKVTMSTSVSLDIVHDSASDTRAYILSHDTKKIQNSGKVSFYVGTTDTTHLSKVSTLTTWSKSHNALTSSYTYENVPSSVTATHKFTYKTWSKTITSSN